MCESHWLMKFLTVKRNLKKQELENSEKMTGVKKQTS